MNCNNNVISSKANEELLTHSQVVQDWLRLCCSLVVNVLFSSPLYYWPDHLSLITAPASLLLPPVPVLKHSPCTAEDPGLRQGPSPSRSGQRHQPSLPVSAHMGTYLVTTTRVYLMGSSIYPMSSQLDVTKSRFSNTQSLEGPKKLNLERHWDDDVRTPQVERGQLAESQPADATYQKGGT